MNIREREQAQAAAHLPAVEYKSLIGRLLYGYSVPMERREVPFEVARRESVLAEARRIGMNV